jgi:hypothetical protein
VIEASAQLLGETGLACPAGAEQRHEAVLVEQRGHRLEQSRPADEAARRARQRMAWCRAGLAGGRLGCRLTGVRRIVLGGTGDDVVVQAAQGGRWFDAELGGEGFPVTVVDGERIGEPARVA